VTNVLHPADRRCGSALQVTQITSHPNYKSPKLQVTQITSHPNYKSPKLQVTQITTPVYATGADRHALQIQALAERLRPRRPPVHFLDGPASRGHGLLAGFAT
jgi:hypothetical protein